MVKALSAWFFTPPERGVSLPWIMPARTRSAAVLGIDAYLVDVATDIANSRASPRWGSHRAR